MMDGMVCEESGCVDDLAGVAFVENQSNTHHAQVLDPLSGGDRGEGQSSKHEEPEMSQGSTTSQSEEEKIGQAMSEEQESPCFSEKESSVKTMLPVKSTREYYPRLTKTLATTKIFSRTSNPQQGRKIFPIADARAEKLRPSADIWCRHPLQTPLRKHRAPMKNKISKVASIETRNMRNKMFKHMLYTGPSRILTHCGKPTFHSLSPLKSRYAIANNKLVRATKKSMYVMAKDLRQNSVVRKLVRSGLDPLEKSRHGSRVERRRVHQSTSEQLICRLHFERLVRSIAAENRQGLRFQRNAMTALQEVAEDLLLNMFTGEPRELDPAINHEQYLHLLGYSTVYSHCTNFIEDRSEL